MKTFVQLWQYLADVFLEWEMLQKIDVRKIKTHFMFNNLFFPKIMLFMRYVENMVQSDGPKITI
jgi:hypothetical protein